MFLFSSFLPRAANHFSAFVGKITAGIWKPITLQHTGTKLLVGGP